VLFIFYLIFYSSGVRKKRVEDVVVYKEKATIKKIDILMK